MKKLIFLAVFGIIGWSLFAQSEAIPFTVSSYQISRRQTASLYERAELIVNDEDQSWEIILYRKEGDPERIRLENFADIGRGLGVFRTVVITEDGGTTGENLFAHMPAFEGNRIRVDLCDTRTEAVRRRLIIEF
jgi:hypothetical protein